MTAKTYKPTAQDAYVSAQATAAAQIECLTELLAQHHDDAPCDGPLWGHVGDLGHVNAQLAEIIAFMSPDKSMQNS